MSVTDACAALGYSRQAYYQPLSERKRLCDADLKKLKDHVEKERKRCPTRGCREMYERYRGPLPIGRDSCIRLLMKMGYRVRFPKRFGKATQSGTRMFPNLLVDRKLTGINQVWQADMAHHLYGDRKYYTIYITDVYNQEIIGFGAYSTNEAVNYADVLKKAIGLRKISCKALDDLIHHGDGGKQYESGLYTTLCKENGIRQSMCMYSYENPYAEKTNDLINNGYLNIWRPKSLKDLIICQKKAVKDHNENSRKKILGKISPIDFRDALSTSKQSYILDLKPKNPEQPRKRVSL